MYNKKTKKNKNKTKRGIKSCIQNRDFWLLEKRVPKYIYNNNFIVNSTQVRLYNNAQKILEKVKQIKFSKEIEGQQKLISEP